MFWLTNSIEPPISHVISEIPISGHPSFIKSCSCFVVNNRGNLLSQYMQLTGREENIHHQHLVFIELFTFHKWTIFKQFILMNFYNWWQGQHSNYLVLLKKNETILTKGDTGMSFSCATKIRLIGISATFQYIYTYQKKKFRSIQN